MPTEQLSWLEYLLSLSPDYELNADPTPEIDALVDAGYLLRIARRIEFMIGSRQLPDGIAITYGLTERGAIVAARQPYPRIHITWKARLAKALESGSEAA